MSPVGEALGEVLRDDDALALQVPVDGSVGSIKAVLDRLDDKSLPVDGISVHTPDLNDVFFALTGQPGAGTNTEKEDLR